VSTDTTYWTQRPTTPRGSLAPTSSCSSTISVDQRATLRPRLPSTKEVERFDKLGRPTEEGRFDKLGRTIVEQNNSLTVTSLSVSDKAVPCAANTVRDKLGRPIVSSERKSLLESSHEDKMEVCSAEVAKRKADVIAADEPSSGIHVAETVAKIRAEDLHEAEGKKRAVADELCIQEAARQKKDQQKREEGRAEADRIARVKAEQEARSRAEADAAEVRRKKDIFEKMVADVAANEEKKTVEEKLANEARDADAAKIAPEAEAHRRKEVSLTPTHGRTRIPRVPALHWQLSPQPPAYPPPIEAAEKLTGDVGEARRYTGAHGSLAAKDNVANDAQKSSHGTPLRWSKAGFTASMVSDVDFYFQEGEQYAVEDNEMEHNEEVDCGMVFSNHELEQNDTVVPITKALDAGGSEIPGDAHARMVALVTKAMRVAINSENITTLKFAIHQGEMAAFTWEELKAARSCLAEEERKLAAKTILEELMQAGCPKCWSSNIQGVQWVICLDCRYKWRVPEPFEQAEGT